ncbi:MAG TPA: cadherin-like domain-containing protein [Clostridia bacterium]|nr:cadherin-like domain-containing protein [Clostridia bacterium]
MESHNTDIKVRAVIPGSVRRLLDCGFLAVLLCSLSIPAKAQWSEDIDAGGISGGVSSAGPYTLQDTVGQTCVGSSASTNYSLQEGFWNMVALPPVAHSPAIKLYSGQSWTLGVSELLTLAWDADHDTICLASFNALTAQGGMVTRNGDLIIYTPPTKYVGTDTFNYTIADSGGDTARGTITFVLTLGGDSRPISLFGSALTNGLFAASVIGVPEATYTVEFTDSLSPSHWQKLTNLTVFPSSGPDATAQFTDPSPGLPSRFYRIVYPAY